MNALAIGMALLVIGCAAIEGEWPKMDQAMERAAKVGGCLKLICSLPLEDCRVRPSRCQQ